jgi:hypothetical protein
MLQFPSSWIAETLVYIWQIGMSRRWNHGLTNRLVEDTSTYHYIRNSETPQRCAGVARLPESRGSKIRSPVPRNRWPWATVLARTSRNLPDRLIKFIHHEDAEALKNLQHSVHLIPEIPCHTLYSSRESLSTKRICFDTGISSTFQK